MQLPLRGVTSVRGLVGFANVVRQRRPDLIHTHLTRATYFGYIVGTLARIPIVSTVHVLTRDAAYRYLPGRRHWFVAVSGHLKEALVARGVPGDRVEIVHNGTDMSPDDPLPDEPLTLRAELGLPPDAVIVGSFARVDEFKGQHILVRAARALVDQCPRAYIVFVGHAEPRTQQALWNLAAADGVADRLRFTGVRDDVRRLMLSTDVVALTSLTEACSMAIIEAMSMGRPVVATRSGGNPELIEDGVTGLLVDRTPRDAAAALGRLCASAELRSDMGRAAAARAREKFSASAMASAMEAVYGLAVGPMRSR